MPASEYSKIWASASLLVSFHLLGEVVHLKLLLILLVDAAILDHHRLGARRVIQAVAATACFLTLDKCLNAAFWYFFLSVVYCTSASSNSNRVSPKPPPTVFTFFRSDSILVFVLWERVSQLLVDQRITIIDSEKEKDEQSVRVRKTERIQVYKGGTIQKFSKLIPW